MKRIIATSLGLIIITLAITSATVRKSSSGAPASHTGAPDEKTCAAAGCHDDHAVNSGTALLDISLGEKVHSIKPGQTYPLRIRISDPEVTRFGFQIVALEEESNKDLGAFSITDSLRTQVIKNVYKHTDRNYVTYTFDGTDAVSSGTGEWFVNWTAPLNLKKAVTFYVAGVSANDDMSDKGDKVYTKSLTINQ